jgi:hypothetical protein
VFRRARRAGWWSALSFSALLSASPIARGAALLNQQTTPAESPLSDPRLIGTAVHLVLDNGDELTGSLLRVQGGRVFIEHPILGEISIPTTRIVRLTGEHKGGGEAQGKPGEAGAQPEAPAPQSPAPKPAPSPPPPAPPPAPKKPAAVWKTRIEFGLDGSQGNAEQLNFRGGLRIDRDTKDTAFRFNSRYVINTANGDRVANRLTANARNDWRLNSKHLSFFVQTGLEYNEFQQFDLRWTGGTGLSAVLIDDGTTRLNTSLGAGFSKEFGSPNDELAPELITGLEFSHKFTKSQKFSVAAEFFPDLEQIGEFRSIVRPVWEIKLDSKTDLSLRLGFEHRYESITNLDSHSDIDYFATLVLSF